MLFIVNVCLNFSLIGFCLSSTYLVLAFLVHDSSHPEGSISNEEKVNNEDVLEKVSSTPDSSNVRGSNSSASTTDYATHNVDWNTYTTDVRTSDPDGIGLLICEPLEAVRISGIDGSLRVCGSSISHYSGWSTEDPRVRGSNVPSFCFFYCSLSVLQ